MDNILKYIINLIVFVPFTIALIIITIKFSKINFGVAGINKYVKVLERTNLSKDTSIYVLKVGDEGCVILSTPTKTDTIKELNKKQVKEIEKNQENIKNKFNSTWNKENIKKLKSKLNLKEKKDGRIGTSSFK